MVFEQALVLVATRPRHFRTYYGYEKEYRITLGGYD